MKKLLFSAIVISLSVSVFGQGALPYLHHNLRADDKGRLYIKDSARNFYLVDDKPAYTLQQLKGNPKGDDRGIYFNFGSNSFKGLIYYGFIPYGDSKHPQPVYFKNAAKIEFGNAHINIKEKLKGKYDMVGWEKNGKGTLGYRVVDSVGNLLYDGVVSFTGKGPFKVSTTIVEGPFVNQVTHNSAILSFETNEAVAATVSIGGKTFTDKATQYHEIELKGLPTDTLLKYTVVCGEIKQSYTLQTAPKPGSRKYFSFSYASDSRNGNGGGERNLYGANYYIVKKMMALNAHKGVAFAQFSGDLIDGYLQNKGETNLQYANWKRAVQPFWHHFPVYISMGNHEALVNEFVDEKSGKSISIDKFPYNTESAEAVFASNFVNPPNGPMSEDGATYDPSATTTDFPSYKENVFYYTYDNVGVIVLNSNYWYAPSTDMVSLSSGNVHGYIMDKQLEWLETTLRVLEEDKNIDHVFLTLHTPFFPNGGHVSDDMWYNGTNTTRPYVKSKPLDKGIIERRDQLLDLLVNKSKKVTAILTGDEHNYCKTEIGPETPIYPKDWMQSKIRLSRTIYQINNGAAGAPYYAQEITPWTGYTTGFTTQNAVVYFHIEGGTIEVEVVNPDTLEEIESFDLR